MCVCVSLQQRGPRGNVHESLLARGAAAGEFMQRVLMRQGCKKSHLVRGAAENRLRLKELPRAWIFLCNVCPSLLWPLYKAIPLEGLEFRDKKSRRSKMQIINTGPEERMLVKFFEFH